MRPELVGLEGINTSVAMLDHNSPTPPANLNQPGDRDSAAKNHWALRTPLPSKDAQQLALEAATLNNFHAIQRRSSDAAPGHAFSSQLLNAHQILCEKEIRFWDALPIQSTSASDPIIGSSIEQLAQQHSSATSEPLNTEIHGMQSSFSDGPPDKVHSSFLLRYINSAGRTVLPWSDGAETFSDGQATVRVTVSATANAQQLMEICAMETKPLFSRLGFLRACRNAHEYLSSRENGPVPYVVRDALWHLPRIARRGLRLPEEPANYLRAEFSNGALCLILNADECVLHLRPFLLPDFRFVKWDIRTL